MDNNNDTISRYYFESITTKLERTIEKLWILCIILIILLVGSNGAWLYYQSQFEETTTVQQEVDANADDGSDLNLTTVGGDYHGGESESQTDNN
jgi:hypothetical protein